MLLTSSVFEALRAAIIVEDNHYQDSNALSLCGGFSDSKQDFVVIVS